MEDDGELFLDTNVILRYLTQDQPDQAERANRVLAQVDAGTLSVTTTEAVLVEAVHVLYSKALYRLPRPQIRDHLADIIDLPGLKIAHRQAYLAALDLYASSTIDFVDALIVAHMRRTGITSVLSFDRIPGSRRQEP